MSRQEVRAQRADTQHGVMVSPNDSIAGRKRRNTP
jgi:hypothetical protein